MLFCRRCGMQIDESDHFCRYCGLGQTAELLTAGGPAPYTVRAVRPRSRYRGVLCLVFSILLFFFLNAVGTPLAAAGAVFAAMANGSAGGQSDRYLRRARGLCIAAAAVDAATLIFIVSFALAL